MEIEKTKSKRIPPTAAELKAKYGNDCFKLWGRKGGNPLLIALKGVEVTVKKKAAA